MKITEAAGFVKVDIKDNGKGLYSGEAAQIERGGYTSKLGGSGIGIKICRNIAARHGGSFSIKNAEQEGCVVTVTLPGIC